MTGADFNDDDPFGTLAPETFSFKVERNSVSDSEPETDSPTISQKEFPTPVKTEFGFDSDCVTVETVETVVTVETVEVAPKKRLEEPREPLEPKSEESLVSLTIGCYDWSFDYGDEFVLPLWGLACRLSAYPSLRGRNADDVADLVQTVRPFRTFPGVDSDSDDPGRDQFIQCWQAVKPGPLGKDAHVIALFEANKEPLPVNRTGGHGSTQLFTKVVNFVYRLQMVEGDRPFLLSARTLSDVAGIHYTAANQYIRRLVFERFINIVEKPRKLQQRAGRYRFIGELENGALAPRGTAMRRQIEDLTRRIELLESERHTSHS